MRILLRASLAISGLIFFIMTLGGYVLRQEPSTAYWILGQIELGSHSSLFLASPDGRIHRELLQADRQNSPEPIQWLVDGHTFLYQWWNDRDIEVWRFSLDSLERTHLGNRQSALSLYPIHAQPIPNRNEHLITLSTDDGAALFSLTSDGTTIQRKTPFHTSIEGYPVVTPDGEWIFYFAEDDQEPPIGLFRQRYDGSEHTELMRFDVAGTLSLWSEDGQSALLYFNPNPSRTADSAQVYRITTTDPPMPITPDDQYFTPLFFSPQTVDDWILLRQHQRNGFGLGIYRVRPNGEDLTPLFDFDPNEMTSLGFTMNLRESVIVGIFQDGYVNLHQITVDTLEQTTLLPDQTFTDISNFRSNPDDQTLRFYGTTADHEGWYQLNLDTLELEELPSLPEANANVPLPGLGPYGLAFESAGSPTRPQTAIYRLNFDTGQYDYLTTLPGDPFDITTYYPPPYGTQIIFSARERAVANGAPQQVLINVESGTVSRVEYGKSLIFSPYFEHDWQPDKLAVITSILCVLALGWSTWLVVQEIRLGQGDNISTKE